MAWTYVFDTATPPGGQSPRLGDDRIREAKGAFHERFTVDHNMDLTGTAHTDTVKGGKHNKVTLLEQGSGPTTLANEGALYTKVVSGKAELFYRAESDGTETQLTSVGYALPPVDDSSIEIASGVLRLKDGGITGPKLTAAVDGATIEINGSSKVAIKVPAAGADADASKACVMVYGDYTADGTETTIQVGATVRAVWICRNDGALYSGGMAVKATASAGNMGIGGSAIGDGGITISGTTFVIAASNAYTNTSTKAFTWVALCER